MTRRQMLAAGFIAAIVLGAIAFIPALGLALSNPLRPAIGTAPPDLHVETVTFDSPSGARLSGWFVQGRERGGAVVLMHGIYASRLAMVRRAQMLHEAGFSVLLFDFQAHGESTGRRITFGHLESRDARAAVAYLRQRLPDERIGAIGASLGGAAALLGPSPLAVDALVLEAAYSDLGTALANRIHAYLGESVGGIIAPPINRLSQFVLPRVIAVGPADLRPIDHMAEITAPVLVACGTRDDRTTIGEAQAMFALAHEPKAFWAVEGAGHVDLERYAPDEYRKRVLAFLVTHVQPAQ